MNRCLVPVAFAVALCFALPSQATVWTFNNIPIDGLQEVPPVATTGTGLGTATLDDVTNTFSISGSFSNLIGTSNNAHIHGPAPPGTPAGVMFPLTFDFGVSSGNFSFNGVITAAHVQTILDGLSYVNIHSTFRPGGEIRGQLLNPIPEPATCLMLVTGAGGLFLLRRRCRR
ncbi:MAG: CHRD domain-containing protein [Pirellulales bacterium]